LRIVTSHVESGVDSIAFRADPSLIDNPERFLDVAKFQTHS